MINLQYITDFYKSRGGRIGASDVPALIPHPDRPNESLAGYGQTAITLYEEKVGLRQREPAGFAAEMGHFLEPKALSEFIRDFGGPVFDGFGIVGADVQKDGVQFSSSIADQFFRGFMLCELDRVGKKTLDCRPFNTTPFRHHTEALTEFGVAHADCVYDASPFLQHVVEMEKKEGLWQYKAHGLTVDFSKPFLIEAKSARYWTVKARSRDRFAGYDLDLKEWQGIPLKHYFQLQYQMALYDVDVAYLSLIFDTSEKRYWKIKANKKHQAELLELASLMHRAIKLKQPPRELAMNAADIRKLYPEIQEDFTELTGDELTRAVDLSKAYRKADDQEKAWKRKKDDALDAVSILMKDQREIKGLITGPDGVQELKTIARWKSTGGGERIMGLKDMVEADPAAVKYLRRKKLIKKAESNDKPDIKLKMED
ncbi:MAG: hypothetical protein CVV44_04145 [Spirochaetae bacterium HGW-Spirochaetae-1]|jgi:hypothetical protein|nr:MAG: hypothetical protein CVV44_04145 [Spirochaetae bacterium HGW-Spirochaetae-1]